MDQVCDQIRYKTGSFDAGKASTSNTQAVAKHQEHDVEFECGEVGRLHLAPNEMESWDLRSES